MTLHTTTGSLAPAPPFDFDKSLDFLGFFAPMQGEQTLAERALAKAVLLHEQIVVFEIAVSGSIKQPRLAYTLHSDQPINDAIRLAAEDRIAFFLSLNDDLRPFYTLGLDDQSFAPLIQRLYGYHQVKFLTPFENACWAVLTQRTPIPIAKKLKQALVERFGASMTIDGQRYAAFPEPARLAAVDPAELIDLVGNPRRAAYLQAISVAFAGTDEAWLRAAPYAEVEAWLRAIKGLGAWSTTFVLLRVLGRWSSFQLVRPD
ncbi:MAG: DNA-3-methyladenine glycosylase 2 family protein [Chloroflexota bacterium]|nr:DNA-3-methyladenine glycosylase 2 family protein [Chloroflexota bacterium]